MKNKTFVGIIITLVVALSFFVGAIMKQKLHIQGLEKEILDLMANDPNNIPVPIENQILKPNEKWSIIYGDDMESRLAYNVNIIINTLQSHAQAIKQLIDPNEVGQKIQTNNKKGK
jgi:hypothetical protein